MGLEEVKNEIIEKANKEAERIIDGGKEEAKAILGHAEEKIKEAQKRLKEEKEKTISNLRHMELSSANSEANKRVLAAKKGLIENTFADAKKRLLKDAKKKKEHLNKLLKKAAAEIDITTVYCSKKDISMIKSGHEATKEVKFQESDIEGGIIVENADGTIRIDYSYDTILDDIKGKELHKIAEMLF